MPPSSSSVEQLQKEIKSTTKLLKYKDWSQPQDLEERKSWEEIKWKDKKEHNLIEKPMRRCFKNIDKGKERNKDLPMKEELLKREKLKNKQSDTFLYSVILIS